MKGFALGLTLKQRRKATRKSPIKVDGRESGKGCWASAGTEHEKGENAKLNSASADFGR